MRTPSNTTCAAPRRASERAVIQSEQTRNPNLKPKHAVTLTAPHGRGPTQPPARRGFFLLIYLLFIFTPWVAPIVLCGPGERWGPRRRRRKDEDSRAAAAADGARSGRGRGRRGPQSAASSAPRGCEDGRARGGRAVGRGRHTG